MMRANPGQGHSYWYDSQYRRAQQGAIHRSSPSTCPPLALSTGGQGRADELAYDPKDHIILVANDRAVDFFVTFISTENPPHVVGKID
jgi:hypothetical protein